jgi:hypothetical protein
LIEISAWIQINKGSERVAVVFKIPHTELVIGGRVLARNGCWSLLKGGIFANFTSHADILFEVECMNLVSWQCKGIEI